MTINPQNMTINPPIDSNKILKRLAVVLNIEQVASEFQCSVSTLKRYILKADSTFSYADFFKSEVEQRIRQNPDCKTWAELGRKIGLSSHTARKYGLGIGYEVNETLPLIGRTLGNWTVLSRHSPSKLYCQCRCGHKALVLYPNLRKKTKGCVKCIGIGGSGKAVINSKGERFISIRAAARSASVGIGKMRKAIGTKILIDGSTWRFDND